MAGFGFMLLVVALSYCVEGVTREYFVAIEEVDWDYAPSGRNLMKDIPLDEDEDASVFTERSSERIGRVYKKAVYLQYTDDTFTQKSERQEHWGLIGPPLKAEEGDHMTVHVLNNASHPFSMHPHGAFYNKSHEGALYYDKTTKKKKLDDEIEAGGRFAYEWDITESFSPTADDPNCITWAYHSHTKSNMDTNSGLIGPLIVCRPGTLDGEGNRNDVDKEFYFLFTVLDENESLFLYKNIQTYTAVYRHVDTEDEDFQESNKMHGINGRMYGNLHGLSACKGDTIAIYSFGVGTEADLHSVHFHGQTIVTHGHRQDTFNVFPGIFVTASLHADNVGTFDLSCSINDHIAAGMSTKFTVNQCTDTEELQPEGEQTPQELEDGLTGNVREFFIGIHEEDWNYGPGGYNFFDGGQLIDDGSDSATFFERGPDRIGGIYRKAIFHEYHPGTFAAEKVKPQSFGILGPLIALEVGDRARITVRNFGTSQRYNIEPHGVFFNDLTEIGPGETHTYEWTVPNSVAPTDIDSDCIAYLYTSSVDPVKDTNSGLVGPMLVCKRGTLEKNLARKAKYILFTVFDENSSHYIEENIRRFTNDPSLDVDDADFQESNLMHAINGRMYGNLNIILCKNAETDIHVMAIGTEVDMHSFFLSGIFYTFRNEYTNVLSVFPHTTASTTVKPTEVGSGSLACKVNDHLVGGMKTKYQIIDCGVEPELSPLEEEGDIRTYYVAAVDEIWDYSPWKPEILDNDLSAFTMQKNGSLIGSKYWKAIYHEYTDDTFTTRKNKPQHLGALGPILKAEAGDKIKIMFKNMAQKQYNMLPWGLERENGAEGADPGETVTYTWRIPKEAVPAENQPPCNGHVYVSSIDEVADVYTGLIGPLIICRKGSLDANGKMIGVDAEFFLSFLVYDESGSHYLDKNIEEFANADADTFDKEDADFLENNLMHGVNGRLGFLEGLEMYDGDRVIWHLHGLGNEVDIHSIHFHAHAYKYISDYKIHADVFPLFPGKTGTVEMDVNAVGRWLVHCHVNDHMVGGMTTTYNVLPKSEKTMKRTACYSGRRRGRRYDLRCSFESPRKLEDFMEQASRNSIEVCWEDFICRSAMNIRPTHIYRITISSTFSIDSETFRDLMSPLNLLVYLYADDIGLRSLHPQTFANHRLLRRIVLRRNYLQDISRETLSPIPNLYIIDLSYNNLYFGEFVTPAEKFRGLARRLDVTHNKRLGTDQKRFVINA